MEEIWLLMDQNLMALKAMLLPILTLLKTVDGAGSGLDADTLDGISSASFVRSDANDSIAATLTVQKIVPVNDSQFDIGANGTRFANGYFDTLYGDGSNLTNLPSQTDNNFTNALLSKLNGIAASATNVTNNNQLTNGAGYITSASLAGVSDGGNAALLDGVDSTSFCRSDQDDSLTGIIASFIAQGLSLFIIFYFHKSLSLLGG